MDKQYAQKLLNQTISDYNLIAGQFSKTRVRVWDELSCLRKFFKNGDKVLDLGCGNGRCAEMFDELEVNYVGIDASADLIRLAKETQNAKRKTHPPATFRQPDSLTAVLAAGVAMRAGNRNLKLKTEFLIADALNLPFENRSFDKVLSVAVWHHIPSAELRLKFLLEAKRVLREGGLMIMTVWNLWQQKFWQYHLKYFLMKIIGQSRLDFQDIFYPWKDEKGGVLSQRYLHAFTLPELRNLTKQANLKIGKLDYLGKNRRNILLMVKKI